MQPQLTIDLTAIKNNYNYLKSLTSAVMAAAVKANCYGLGTDAVVPVLLDAGCRDFFVAHLKEAMELEKLLTEANIYVLNGVSEGQKHIFTQHQFIPVLSNLHQLEIWGDSGRCIVHLDTGMNRLGISSDDFDSLTSLPKGTEYIMSHLACDGDKNDPYNKYQLDNFIKHTARYDIKRSLAASGGIFLGKEYHFDMVRPGAALYGIGSNIHKQLANPITLTAPIIHINIFKEDSSVGYGSDGKVSAGSHLATIPIGYGDGYSRFFSNKGMVFINGKAAPVIGRISMDLTVLDVTGLDCKIGDLVEIIGPNHTPDEIASSIGTIGYEVLTSLKQGRFERRYC